MEEKINILQLIIMELNGQKIQKDNVICLNKQQIKDVVGYLLFNYYFNL